MRNRSCKGLQSERLRVLVEYCRIQWEWITGFAELTAVVDVYYNFPAGCSGCCGCCSFFFFVESLATLANSDLKARRASRAESSGSARCPAAKHHEAPWSTTKHQDLPSISRRYQGDIKEISRICKRYWDTTVFQAFQVFEGPVYILTVERLLSFYQILLAKHSEDLEEHGRFVKMWSWMKLRQRERLWKDSVEASHF